MTEVVELEEKERITLDVKAELGKNANTYMNFYYRAEGTFMFSLITLIFLIFVWDTISEPLFFFLFTVIFNFLLMLFFLFKHFQQKKLF